ncbi:MAG: MBOAT family protein [Clostridia bacterium]|nr:MBOAT family protein [Clostridia bacterium]
MFQSLSFSYISAEYILLFPVIFLIYAAVPKNLRSATLTLAGFLYLALLKPMYALWAFAVCLLTYFIGIRLEVKKYNRRSGKPLLILALTAVFVLLFVLKYAGSLGQLLPQGKASDFFSSIALPVGISFYSFSACGYLIDVYRGKRDAEHNIFNYALFLVLFPCVTAGPIGRADRLLPQIKEIKSIRIFDFSRIGSGATLMLWGYFLKLVVADRAAVLANTVFNNAWARDTFALLVGAAAYSIQIYADFAGISCMALGGAKVLGFDVIDNFDAPYLTDSIREFWRRWHISLSGWLRDYLYIPLGGSRKGTARKYVNILIVFTVCGIWHGGRLTFLVWGLLHGVYQLIGGLTAEKKQRIYKKLRIDSSSLPFRVWRTVCNFALVTFAWIFFRADSLTDAWIYISRMFTRPDLWNVMNGSIFNLGLNATEFGILTAACAVVFAADLLKYRNKENVSVLLRRQHPIVRYALIGALLIAVLVFGRYGTSFPSNAFIYAEF